ncbi:MAG: hypothetical protein O2894_06430, partial [Planctomycetota bacterium]|nr:hypothetical protein [Planctomycetota bacterium]
MSPPRHPEPSAAPRGDYAGCVLLTGPGGAGKTTHALERIRAAATRPGERGRDAARPDEALLVLPTYAQVNHVKRVALSRWDARGIFDRPFATFTAVGERYLEAFRVGALPSPEERDRLMEEALRQRDVPVFRSVADRAGFRAHVLRLVKELKQTGLEGGEAREHLVAAQGEVQGASLRKLEGFIAVFEAYEDLLERAGLEDHEDALRRVAMRLEAHPPARPPRLLVVDGFDDFSRVEERILDALARAVVAAGGDVLVTLPWDPARPHLFATTRGSRERLLRLGYAEKALSGFPRAADPALTRIATSLFGPAGSAVPGGDAVGLMLAGDAEDEAETVARAVRGLAGTEGVRGWRDVGVIVRSLDASAPRLESAFARVGVPLRVVGRGTDLASEPVVRALAGPLAVLEGLVEAGQFKPVPLIAWLRWRALLGGETTVDAAVALDTWDFALRSKGFPADFAALRAAAPAPLNAWLDVLEAWRVRLAAVVGAAGLYDGLGAALVALAPLPEPSGFDPEGYPRDREHDERLARAVAGRGRFVGILASLRDAAARTRLGGAERSAQAVSELRDALGQVAFRPQDRRLDA